MIQLGEDIGANLFMKVLPYSILADKIGTVSFPENMAVFLSFGGEYGMDDSGRDK
jgi:hypothetical protein